MILKYNIFIFIFLFLAACQAPTKRNTQGMRNLQQTDKKFGALSKNGMVSAAHPLATAVGVEILKQGGNATDAAVAIFFALAVVYPRAGNIGGGGFAVCRQADGTSSTLDFREKAPLKASRDMYVDANGNAQNNLSLAGHLAVGVPASVAGMVELHKKQGKLTWAVLVEPAIQLAQNGFVVTQREAEYLNKYKQEIIENNLQNLPNHLLKEADWKEGDMIYHKDLAKTLTLIKEKGRAGFYEGETATLLLQEMQRGKGIVSQEDLDNYQAVWRKPVIGNYKKYKIITMPPPSSGGIALLQLLKASEGYPLAKWGHNTPASIHTMVEMQRRVYADRATHLGDPDFYKVPQAMLLSKAYLKKRMADINLKQKTSSQAIKEGKVEQIDSFETTHFSVVDKDRNAVAITTTLNGNYGCKVMVAGAGFFLNNEMDDFSIKVGVPNQFGLVGGEANAIVANKRMLSSMTPTILEDETGKLFMVVGTPGGSTIITAVYQTILNVIEYKMTMQEAVNAKKFHHQWLPDEIVLEEKSFSEKLQADLAKYGHKISYAPLLGKMDCVLVLPDGILEGGADYTRGDNRAAGY
jgi:gamma-glutamyltranspeptidase / glutathione hydrolase